MQQPNHWCWVSWQSDRRSKGCNVKRRAALKSLFDDNCLHWNDEAALPAKSNQDHQNPNHSTSQKTESTHCYLTDQSNKASNRLFECPEDDIDFPSRHLASSINLSNDNHRSKHNGHCNHRFIFCCPWKFTIEITYLYIIVYWRKNMRNRLSIFGTTVDLLKKLPSRTHAFGWGALSRKILTGARIRGVATRNCKDRKHTLDMNQWRRECRISRKEQISVT